MDSPIPTPTELAEKLNASEGRLTLAIQQEFEADGQYRAADAALVIALDEAHRTAVDDADIDAIAEPYRRAVDDAAEARRTKELEVKLAGIEFTAILHRIAITQVAIRKDYHGYPNI
jgi:hypothetical protein